ncbi:MAG: hypothetical protein ACR2NH_06545 [Solirubrobacteraceae bacterium]
MPPTDRLVPRFAAEPPQEKAPYGRWATKLSGEFFAACLAVDAEGEELGEPGDVTWYPDRTYNGRTYLPATAHTDKGYEYFGYVSWLPGSEGTEPSELEASADFTSETAEANPDWTLDLGDEVIGAWRGEEGKSATVTLVWGRPVKGAGAIVTAELAGLAVDQCVLVEDRFTLVAPDDYRGDFIAVVLWDRGGREVARESLYEDDGEDDAPESADE